jgi:hypothetical protein
VALCEFADQIDFVNCEFVICDLGFGDPHFLLWPKIFPSPQLQTFSPTNIALNAIIQIGTK